MKQGVTYMDSDESDDEAKVEKLLRQPQQEPQKSKIEKRRHFDI